MYGLEGRYACALFSAANKKSLEKVEEELKDKYLLIVNITPIVTFNE